MLELKLVITGNVGAGKSTAVKTISEIPPVVTDVNLSAKISADKQETTVALDYGKHRLNDGRVVHLYGTPGQERFSFMWDILSQGATGLIILIDTSTRSPLQELENYLNAFSDYSQRIPTVIGLTHIDKPGVVGVEDFRRYLTGNGMEHPVFPMDARKRQDVAHLIEMVVPEEVVA